jgi:predicted PurR-regulated permease PerM
VADLGLPSAPAQPDRAAGETAAGTSAAVVNDTVAVATDSRAQGRRSRWRRRRGGGPEAPVREVDLDWRSVAWVLGAFVGLLAVTNLIRTAPRAVTVLAVGTLLALALTPLVTAAQRRLHLGRPGAVAAVVAGLVLVVVAAMALLLPPAIRQGRELGGDLDEVVGQIETLPVVGDDLAEAGTADKVRQWIEDLPDRLEGDDTPIGEAAVRVADGFIAFFFTLLVTISLLLDGERLVRGVRRLFPPHRRAQADRIGRLAYETVGRYVAGSVLVAGIAGLFILVVGLFFGVPLTPLLALWVAVFDLVPQIGGAMGGIPFVLLGLTQGITTGLICAGLFVLYLQFENHVLGPVIVGKSVHLSPPATMTAALIGVSAGGVVGALLAVPVVASVKVVYLELRRPPPEPDIESFMEPTTGDGSGVSEPEPTEDPAVTEEAVTSVPLEDEDGNEYVIAQQNSGAADSTEGGGEYPDPDTPPQPPAPGASD